MGGQADIWLAQTSGKPLILKFKRCVNEDFEELLLREFDHPNIVKLLNVTEFEGRHALVLEWFNSMHLSDLIRYSPQNRLGIGVAKYIARALVGALEHVHQPRFYQMPQLAVAIHGDISLANLLVDEAGHIKVCDFGAGVFLGREGEYGQVLGHADLLSPEQLRGEPLTVGADLYGLGRCLVALLGENVAQLEKFDRWFFYWLKACLSPSPQFRPSNLGASLELLSFGDPGEEECLKKNLGEQVARARKQKGPIL